MNDFETQLILSAFTRCYNLREMLHNTRLQIPAIDTLSYQTGLRVTFINEHLEEILAL